MVTYYAGWTDGWDEGFADKNNGSTFLGGLCDQFLGENHVRLVCLGRKDRRRHAPTSAQRAGNIYYNCFVFTHKITDKLTYVFEHDLGSNYNVEFGRRRRQ